MSILESDLFYLEVLPRLPLKSLTRLKCVSKTLKAAISSPEFVQLYLRRQLLNSDGTDLLVLSGSCRIRCYDLDSPPHLPAAAVFLWFDKSVSLIAVIGSIKGLLCVVKRVKGTDQLILLNPSTRICRSISAVISNAQLTNYGFGFDHENHDFKIVVVCDQYSPPDPRRRTTYVYSLNSNSWRMVETTLPKDSMEQRSGGALINSHLLHWLFWIPSLGKRRIGCFDVCTEKWMDDVLLPAYYYDPSHKNYLLDFGVLDGCLFSSFDNRVDSCFDVWVMKEYGVQDSWVKLLSIPVSNDLEGGVVPIVCRRLSDDILFKQRHKARLFWYNRVDNAHNSITEAAFHRAPNFAYHQVYTCMRSLISISGGVLFEELQDVPEEGLCLRC